MKEISFCFSGEGDMSLLHLPWKNRLERKKSQRKVFLSSFILRCNKGGHVSICEKVMAYGK